MRVVCQQEKNRQEKKECGYELNLLDPIETTTAKGRSVLQNFKI
jgi:hypothetical protein